MHPSSSPPTPPSPCQYCYRYTPSTSSSAIPISYFALSCNFTKLASKYPSFQNALMDIHSRNNDGKEQKQQQQQQQQKQYYNANDDKRVGSTKTDAQAAPLSSSTTFSTQITHNFNVSLTRALLNEHFQLQLPSLPEGHLCPPLPNRANYICWLNELIERSEQDLYKFFTVSSHDDASNANNDAYDIDANSNNGHEWQCQGIDIGTGVSAIYPILLTTKLFVKSKSNSSSCDDEEETCLDEEVKGGRQKQQWKFLATDIDPIAISSARTNIQANNLEDQICVVQVKNDEDEIAHSSSKMSGKSEKIMEQPRKGPLFAAMDEAKQQSMFRRKQPFGNETSGIMKSMEGELTL